MEIVNTGYMVRAPTLERIVTGNRRQGRRIEGGEL